MRVARLQLLARHREIHQPHRGRFLAGEGLARAGIVERIAIAHHLGHVPADDAARQDSPIHFGKAEGRLVGGDREIAGAERRERAAEAIAVHHRDGRLLELRQFLPAPMMRIVAGRGARLGIVLGAAEIELDVLSGRERFARPRDHDDLGRILGLQIVQRLAHLPVHLRAHGVALLRAVQNHECDPVRFALDHDRLVGFRHVLPPEFLLVPC